MKKDAENKRNFVAFDSYQEDMYVCLQKNGYRNVFCYGKRTKEEIMEHLSKDLKGKIITEENAQTDDQKKLLEEMKDFMYKHYIFPRRFETEQFYNKKRAEYRKERK